MDTFGVGPRSMAPELRRRAGVAAQAPRGTRISGAAEMAVIRARISRLAGAALTRYDALRERAGGGDEEALQSRRQTD